MNQLLDLLNARSQSWWPYVLHATWQSTLIALAVLALATMGRRWPSPLRYGLLVVALLKFAMPPLLSIPTGVFSLTGLLVTLPVAYQVEVESLPTMPSAAPIHFPDGSPRSDIVPHPDTQPSTVSTVQADFERAMMRPFLSWQGWLMLAHFMGALLTAGWMLYHIRRLSRMIRGGRVILAGPVYQNFMDLCKDLGIRRIPRLTVLEEDCAPSAFGILRPTVIIPASLLSNASAASLRTVLAHELAHFRRWDLYTNWMQLILLVLWWFNPVYWLLSRKIRQIREDCCDDLLLAHGIVSGEGYCETLLEVARRIRAGTPIGAALGFSERIHPLGRRLRRLLDPELKRISHLSIPSTITLIIFSALFLPGLNGPAEKKSGADSQAIQAETSSTITTDTTALSPKTKMMTLVVLSEDGNAPLSCEVTITSSSGCGYFETHDASLSIGDSGEISFSYPDFKIGTLSIKAHKPGYCSKIILWSNTPSIDIPEKTMITLGKGKTIGGQVVNEDGRGISGVEVYLQAVNSKNLGQKDGLPFSSKSPDVPVITDPEGHWSADGIPDDADHVEFRLSHPDYASDWDLGDSGHFSLEDLLSQKAVSVMKRGIPLTGNVLDMHGQPIWDASVSQHSGQCSSITPKTRTGINGRFEFTHSRPGETLLIVQADGYSPQLKELTVSKDPTAVEVRLQPGKIILGKILGVDGKPVAGASVGVESWRGRRSLQWEGKTKDDGAFRWIEAPSDEVSMYINGEGYMLSSQKMMPSEKDYVITLKKAIKVKGTVVDAETVQPIEGFSISQGIFFEGKTKPTWISIGEKYIGGNHFEAVLTVPYQSYCIRVDRAGYQPGISRSFNNSETEVSFEIRLNKGVNPSGIVKDTGGKPLEGMDVYLITQANQIIFQNGKIVSGLHDLTPVKTDDKGRFEFIPQIDPFKILVANDMGYAEASDEELKANPEVTFKPWGRVEGELRVGNAQEAAGEIINLNHHLDPSVRGNTMTFFMYKVETDSDGRFVFERVRKGDATVSWGIKTGLNSDTFSYGESIEVKPGETTHITLGGYGRPVIGKIIVPATATEPISFKNYRSGFNKKIPDAFDPKLLMGMSEQEQRKFWEEWPESEANKEYRKRSFHRNRFAFPINEDGSFAASDIPSGTYNLFIGVYPNTSGQSDQEKPIAAIKKVVNIPEIPGGRSDEPFDLGELQLTFPKK